MKANKINIKIIRTHRKYSINVSHYYFIIVIYCYWNRDPDPLHYLAPAGPCTLIHPIPPATLSLLQFSKRPPPCPASVPLFADSLTCLSLPPSLALLCLVKSHPSLLRSQTKDFILANSFLSQASQFAMAYSSVRLSEKRLPSYLVQ